MSLESFHNYFEITIKSRKTMENLVFSTIECDPEIIIE